MIENQKMIMYVALALIVIFMLYNKGFIGRSTVSGGVGKVMNISFEELKKMIGENPKLKIVDVRTKEEYNTGHVPNAMLIPNETIGSEPPTQLKDKDEVIILYCRSGNRSGQAATKLSKMGYTKLYNFGGVGNWKDKLD